MKDADKAGLEPHPDDLKALARRMLPMIEAYYQSEEGQREFEEWKREKEKEQESNG